MTSPRTLLCAIALATITALASVLHVSAPAAASCLPLQVPPADAVDTVVVAGTVSDIDGVQTELDVDVWFLGDEPTATIVVVGGREPDLITSADWLPAVGEQYVVVAARTMNGALETALCQQQMPTPTLLSTLEATYGTPMSQPELSPQPSVSPTASDASGPSASFVPADPTASP